MLYIAVCDDERAICGQIETMLMETGRVDTQQIEVEAFYSGEDLLRALSDGMYFDLIFLDIEFQNINGIQVGQTIREEMKNETTQIIYISGKDSYAMRLFEVRPFQFLIKPLRPEQIREVARKAARLIRKTSLFFEFKSGHTQFKVSLKDILYFESNGKKVRLITRGRLYEFYGKLSEIEKQLHDQDFIRIHKSYLVNYYHVMEYQYESIKLSDKTVLAISQQQRKSVRERLFQRRCLEGNA
ncbi:MAG: LytTR family DNA-binding domain-containing protein [Oscillospiraceae bacterium]|nr:LytTR family DNA-binding domain-containing protein [Oscillospiraceae bacterium]